MPPADEHYAEITREIARLLDPGVRPVLVGIAGAVGVGKSTTAEILRRRLLSMAVATEVVPTDGFLFPNEELQRRGLAMRKGFPGTFDDEALAAALDALRSGASHVVVPCYSHLVYDRMPGPGRLLLPADVVIVEGVNALQPPVVERLDLPVYLEADEADLHAWFVDRFLALCREAEHDDGQTSFYASFAGVADDQRRAVAEAAWSQINLVNLRDHIAPSRAHASLVLHKRADHTIRALSRGEPP